MTTSDTQWTVINTKSKRHTSNNIGTEADKVWNGDFFFVVGSDPQFGFMDVLKNSDYNPQNLGYSEELRLAKLAVEKVNKLNPKPKFFIICGDLTNEFPGNEGLATLKEKQINDFKTVFSLINKDISLVCVCGNHDVGNVPTVETIAKYRSDFGDDYFSFWCSGVFFIVLNSQYFQNSKNVPKLAKQQEKWLDDQLNAADGKTIICFSHVPWFMENLEEEDEHFNIPHATRIRILEKLHKAGVRYVFCGHFHKNSLKFYKDMEIIVTTAIGMQLGSDQSGLRLVKVNNNKISHMYYPLDNVPNSFSLS